MGLYTIWTRLLVLTPTDYVQGGSWILITVEDVSGIEMEGFPGKSSQLFLNNTRDLTKTKVGEAEKIAFKASTSYRNIPAEVEATILKYARPPLMEGNVKIGIKHNIEGRKE